MESIVFEDIRQAVIEAKDIIIRESKVCNCFFVGWNPHAQGFYLYLLGSFSEELLLSVFIEGKPDGQVGRVLEQEILLHVPDLKFYYTQESFRKAILKEIK